QLHGAPHPSHEPHRVGDGAGQDGRVRHVARRVSGEPANDFDTHPLGRAVRRDRGLPPTATAAGGRRVRELRMLRALWPIMRRHRWAVALLVVVGALASLCEGLGITLFIPLLYSLQPEAFEASVGRGVG